MSAIRRYARAFPTLLRIGFAESVAYRAEFVVWMLTTTMPLVMLALWTAVARDGQFGRFGQKDFVAYYLGALIVRTVTGCWVQWEMNQEIRMGTLSLRLLRPIHPFYAYMAEHMAAIPLRGLMALPIASILLIATQGSRLAHDPLVLGLLPVVLAGAWFLTFVFMCILGTLGLLIERSVAAFEIYLGVFAVMSGYLIPLELMPGWVRQIADWLPFRYMLGFPVEAMIGMASRGQVLAGLAIQWGMILALALVLRTLWRIGVRRFEAYGA